jgi:AraC family transcriptional regulator
MDLFQHGERKFPQAGVLGSSLGLGWRGIAAELRFHPAGDLPPFESRQIEITIAPRRTQGAVVSRKGWGIRQQTPVEQGTIWISPVGVAEDDIRISAPLPEILHLYLAPESFRGLEGEAGLPLASPYAVRYLAGLRDPLIEHLGRALADEMGAPSAGGRLLGDSLALSLAARLAQRYSDSAARPAGSRAVLDRLRVQRAIDFMHARLDEDISLEALAAVACVSPFHFARVFRATLGIPPHRYLADLRIERAKLQLAQGVMPLAQVAQSALFATQANFSRAFRKATGMTPGEYRSAAR